MSKLIVKFVWGHSPKCISRKPGYRERNPQMQDFWLDTFGPRLHVNLSSAGDNRGTGYRWLELGCAWDSSCGAKVRVRVDSLEEMINEALGVK
jgi:hypothetical protein